MGNGPSHRPAVGGAMETRGGASLDRDPGIAVMGITAAAMAMSASSHDEMALATNGSIEWVKSAYPGDRLTAIGTTRWKGKRPSLHDAVVTNQDGVEIAHFYGRMQRVGGTISEFLHEREQRP